ncbi:2-oxoglutarate dehydrogenase E1 subunit family protein, partial [Mycobacterium parmense]
MSNISSPFGQNEWLVEEMYRKFREDPSSVDPSWHEFLVDYNPEPATQAAKPTDAAKATEATAPAAGATASPADGRAAAAPKPTAPP